MRIALAQFNASVGDIKGNVNKMQDFSIKAFELGADIVVFPEISVCGYPPEDQLDRVLKGYVEEDKSASQLIEEGLPKTVVKQVINMVDHSEHKRRLSPPGIKITPKAFGKDRRMPITNLYTSEGFYGK